LGRHSAKKFEAYTTGVIIVNVFYFVKKHKNLAEANMAVATLLKVLQVCTVDTAVLQAARTSAITILKMPCNMKRQCMVV
jgi:hypothetical protein